MEGRPLEESELIARARAADPRAYGELVQRYQEVAFRTAYLVAGDAAEAEDAAQEAFVKAYYALDRFRTGEPFRPWLLQIVANEARNRRKAAGRRANLALRAEQERPPGEAAPSPGGAASSPEGAVLAAEQRRELLVALDELREDDRLVLAYRYFLDLDEAEMAEAMSCARGTVKSRLFRALGRLRSQFVGEEGRRG